MSEQQNYVWWCGETAPDVPYQREGWHTCCFLSQSSVGVGDMLTGGRRWEKQEKKNTLFNFIYLERTQVLWHQTGNTICRIIN